LKNHALLLFGPSSFEHWFKSCKPFTVRSLSFSDFTDQSTNQFIPLFLRRLCSPCSASPGSSTAGVKRRSGSPPAISRAPPLATRCFPAPHRPSPLVLAPHPSATTLPRLPALHAGVPAAAAIFPPACLILPSLLLSGIRNSTLLASLAQLLTKPRPTAVSPLFFFPASPEPPAFLAGIRRKHSTSPKSC
jgi:hypothetical protein